MILNDHLQSYVLLFGLDLLVTLLSFSASSLVAYFCFRRMKTSDEVLLRLIFALVSSDFFFAIANIISVFESEPDSPDSSDSQFSVGTLCYIEAVIRAFSFVLSVSFVTSISVLCYKTFNRQYSLTRQRMVLYVALLSGAAYALILVLMPLFLEDIVYTKGPQYCWITYSDKLEDSGMRLLIRIIYEGNPIILGVLITFLGYASVFRRAQKEAAPLLRQFDVSLSKLFWYPFTLFIGFVPCLIDNIVGIYYPERPVAVQAIHIVLTHSIGLTNAIVYWGQKYSYQKIHEEVRAELPAREHEEEPSLESLSRGQEESLSSASKSLLKASSLRV